MPDTEGNGCGSRLNATRTTLKEIHGEMSVSSCQPVKAHWLYASVGRQRSVQCSHVGQTCASSVAREHLEPQHGCIDKGQMDSLRVHL